MSDIGKGMLVKWQRICWGKLNAMIEDEEPEEGEVEAAVGTGFSFKRKRLLILLLPLLIVIGISVGIFFALNNTYDSDDSGYNIVQYDKENKDNIAVFYDMPEIRTSVAGKDMNHALRLKLNLELSNVEDLRIVEILTPKLNDVVLSHIIELTIEEISGSAGLYWLKEELLYRLNLAAEPAKIKDLNFSVFELQK